MHRAYPKILSPPAMTIVPRRRRRHCSP